MKAELEILSLEQQNKSFNFFEVETSVFAPYWHYHPELELTLITKGHGTRFVGDSILPYSEGDLVLIGENLPHHWVSADNSPAQGAIVIQFPGTLFSSIKECAELKTLFQKANQGLFFPTPDPKLIALLYQFSQHSSLGQVSHLLSILHLLEQDRSVQPLSSIFYGSNKRLEKQQTKVSETIQFILEHLAQRLTVEQLAERTHMVPQSFCRWFRKSVGISFITFLNSSRVEHACHQLIMSDSSILEIAYTNGFDSISHFNRTFKKVKGQSPGHYRKSWQNSDR